MSFDDLIRVASETAPKTIPTGAEKHLKHSISAQTQEKLLKIEPNKAMWMMIDAVNEVNHGSIETIEELILKRMDEARLV